MLLRQKNLGFTIVGSHRKKSTIGFDAARMLRRGRHRASTALRTSLRNGSALGLAAVMVAAGLVIAPQAAVAADVYGVGSHSASVPSGACFVTATVVGGGGGNYMLNGTGLTRGGSGASVTATFPVTPGSNVSVTVGSGGNRVANQGGSPGGGAPGQANNHHGAGGGGYSELVIGGQTLILAGGGGGTGGGHSLNVYAGNAPFPTGTGQGGDAGRPTGVGEFAGTAGGNGIDRSGPTDYASFTGGRGGGPSGPGAGGVSHGDFRQFDGSPGSGRSGGAGANDLNEDAGGGGGGGWRGGGGGAATLYTDVAGSGGGGGSSYVAASATGVSSTLGSATTAGPVGETGANPGANGSVTLDWDTANCGTAVNDVLLYQPTGSPVTVPVLDNDEGFGSALRLSNGQTSMVVAGQGTWDVVGQTVRFTPLPEFTGNPTPVGYRWLTSGGGTLKSATVTVGYVIDAHDDEDLDNELGQAVTLLPLGNDTGGVSNSSVRLDNGSGGWDQSVTVPGEGTWTVNTTTGAITFTPAVGFFGDPNPIDYRVTDSITSNPTTIAGAWDTATVRVTYLPVPLDDVSFGNTPGASVAVDVFVNDHSDIDRSSVMLVDPDGDPVTTLHVPGEGSWSVDPAGTVVFEPEAGFDQNPTPVTYRVDDPKGGAPLTATVTVAYLPVAQDDSDTDNRLGDTVTLDPLLNDTDRDDLVPGTVRLLDGITPVTTLIVVDEGTWTVDTDTGEVTFTPEPGFTGDPSPVSYTVSDSWGESTDAQITVGYLVEAFDDVSAGNEPGDPVTILVTDNDHDELLPGTVRLIDAAGDPVLTMTVPGEGEWTVDPSTGEVTFTPEPDLVGNPTPVRYRVEDSSGVPVEAMVRVAYIPQAAPDEDLLNPLGETVTVDPLVNDTDRDDLDPSSVLLWNGSSWVDSLSVPGEGTWTVNTVTGEVEFEPLLELTHDPSPVEYRVADEWGVTAESTITITYRPDARDDVSIGHMTGNPATVDVTANDYDALDPATVQLVTPGGGLDTTLTVPGEGTWTVDPATGEITFEPEPGFDGHPTPVEYRIETFDRTESSTATVTVAYVPTAHPDENLLQPFGLPVTVADIIANDTYLDYLDPSTLRLIDGAGASVTELDIPGEGTWTVDPDEGTATFTPLATFMGDPSPVPYRIADVFGQTAESTVTVSYLPDARDDEDLDNVLGTTVVVDAIGNDHDALLPSTLRLVDAIGDPVTVLAVPGEGTWTVDAAGHVTFVPEPGFLVDPTSVGYQIEDAAGTIVTATVTVTYLPTVIADESLGNPAGDPVVVPVLDNDTGEFIPNSVRLVNPDGDPVTTLVVLGEGTWTVDGLMGVVTFIPVATFPGNPTPVSYRVTDVTGDTVETTVTVTYQVSVVDVVKGGNESGDPVTVPVPLHPDVDPGTLRIIDPDTGDPVTTMTVPGEGTWTVDTSTGEITFTPELGFTGNPTPIEYQVEDPATGDPLTATITVLYGPLAHDDESIGNPFGEPVDVPVLGNDEGLRDPGTVLILTPGSGDPVTELSVPGEGIWTVDPTAGVITFTPEDSFTGDPTPIEYRVTDANGEEATATVTVTYRPDARDDVSRDNTAGEPVRIDVTGNDHNGVDPGTVRLIDPKTGSSTLILVVSGEGSWTVEPRTGIVTFTPAPGFQGSPAPVKYTALDSNGFEVNATITIGYAETALSVTGADPFLLLFVALILLVVGVAVRFGARARRT